MRPVSGQLALPEPLVTPFLAPEPAALSRAALNSFPGAEKPLCRLILHPAPLRSLPLLPLYPADSVPATKSCPVTASNAYSLPFAGSGQQRRNAPKINHRTSTRRCCCVATTPDVPDRQPNLLFSRYNSTYRKDSVISLLQCTMSIIRTFPGSCQPPLYRDARRAVRVRFEMVIIFPHAMHHSI